MIAGMAKLERYEFGQVVVDGRPETRDLIVLPHRVVRGWWRAEGHSLDLSDLAPVLDELPERLIVGCGASMRMRPTAVLLAHLQGEGIAVELLPTAQAVRRYAELDPARTAAALHLTC
jgi:hypothetical protein